MSLALLMMQPASAHPLGNFTINHLSILSQNRTTVHLRYVLDEAEIPSFETLAARQTSSTPTGAFLQSWSKAQAKELLPQLHLDVDGQPVAWTLDRAQASSRPGAGGLPTFYWVADMHAAALHGHHLHYQDATYANRLGWKDVIVRPATEPTHELRAYPNMLIGSPRERSTIDWGTRTSVHRLNVEGPQDRAAVSGVSVARSNQLSDLLARGTHDWQVVLLTFIVSVGLGALHALEPGHGKTLLAVSLVGARATTKQALILAGSLTFAHTIGVILLGSALLVGARYIVPELIYPWITLGSGMVIAVLGAKGLARSLNRLHPTYYVHEHEHAHGAGGHQHQHADLDEEEHARLHAQAFAAGPLSFRGVVIAAMSGGVAPCPAALVVLLTALTLHQVAYGLAIIVAFSLGLAGILTGLGLAVVRGADWISSRPQFDRVIKTGPLISSMVIASIGAIMVGQGFVQSGIAASWLAVVALTATAIASFVFFPHQYGAR